MCLTNKDGRLHVKVHLPSSKDPFTKYREMFSTVDEKFLQKESQLI